MVNPVSRCLRPILASDCSQFADPLVVIELIDGADIETHQVHVGLQKRGKLCDLIVGDDQEPGATPGQVVPPVDSIGIIGPSFGLFD